MKNQPQSQSCNQSMVFTQAALSCSQIKVGSRLSVPLKASLLFRLPGAFIQHHYSDTKKYTQSYNVRWNAYFISGYNLLKNRSQCTFSTGNETRKPSIAFCEYKSYQNYMNVTSKTSISNSLLMF
jgi:hypothetical protein